VAYVLNEAGVAATTSSTFSVSCSGGTPYDTGYGSVFLSNVDQNTTIGATDSNGVTSGNKITAPALTTSSGDMVIDAVTCGNTCSTCYTLNNSFTKG
jgi:hypothetical protein